MKLRTKDCRGLRADLSTLEWVNVDSRPPGHMRPVGTQRFSVLIPEDWTSHEENDDGTAITVFDAPRGSEYKGFVFALGTQLTDATLAAQAPRRPTCPAWSVLQRPLPREPIAATSSAPASSREARRPCNRATPSSSRALAWESCFARRRKVFLSRPATSSQRASASPRRLPPKAYVLVLLLRIFRTQARVASRTRPMSRAAHFHPPWEVLRFLGLFVFSACGAPNRTARSSNGRNNQHIEPQNARPTMHARTRHAWACSIASPKSQGSVRSYGNSKTACSRSAPFREFVWNCGSNFAIPSRPSESAQT